MSILLTLPTNQLAYVTSDFDAALNLFATRYGMNRFLELRNFTMATGPGRAATLHIGLAYAGPMQIEVMQPLSGDDGAWRRALRGTGQFEMVFHHECHLLRSRADIAAVRDALAQAGFPVIMEGEAPGIAYYLYADQTSTIGHAVEYICYEPAAFTQLEAAIPRFSVNGG